jgi:ubiquinone/menaquinone biosynthesis C-methylase UbiE
MSTELYTPGHSQNATAFMSKRSLTSHGEFFAPYFERNVSVLDCGCGPGSITIGIAERVSPGRVVGVDFAESQITEARAFTSTRSLNNVSFQVADCYSLPFESNSFDRAFSHALFEHLSDPVRGLREIHRVLKPDGVVGICSPDWGGFIMSPPSADLARAVAAYTTMQSRNGGDVEAGRKLGAYLAAAGFEAVKMSARYECYTSLDFIGEYLALQLEREGDTRAAAAFRTWSRSPAGMFAQAWVSAIGCKLR